MSSESRDRTHHGAGMEDSSKELLGQDPPAGSPGQLFTQAGVFFRTIGCDSRLNPGGWTHWPQLP